MLAEEQVKRHSEINLKVQPSIPYTVYQAALTYKSKNKFNRLIVIGNLLKELPYEKPELMDEAVIQEFIDWKVFTDWINSRIDLAAADLLPRRGWKSWGVKLDSLVTLDTIQKLIIFGGCIAVNWERPKE